MWGQSTSVTARYTFTLAAVALATGLRMALAPALGDNVPFILYYVTIVFCAWYGGLWHGLVSTALSTFLAWYLFMPPHSFALKGARVLPLLITYILTGSAISLLAANLHRARTRAQESEAAAERRGEELRVTLTSIGDAVIATDAECRVSFMNPVAESLTGWKQAEALGRPLGEVFRIINEQMRQPAENPAQKALETGVTVGQTDPTLLISRDGTERPIDENAAPIRDKEGVMVGAVLVFRDSSERRRNEERYRGLFTSMQEGLLVAEIVEDSSGGPVDFRYLDMNPAAERILGIGRSQVVGRTAREIIPQVREDQLLMFAGVARTGEPVSFEVFEPLVNQYHQSFGFRPAPGQVAVLFWDVTERKRAEMALAETADSLARERARLGVALLAGQMGVYEWRMGENSVWWSPEVYPLYGVEPASFNPTVEAFTALVHPDDREELWRKTQESLARRTPFMYEYRIIRPDGELRWISNSSQVSLGATGDVEHITGVAVDITDRKKAEAEREELLAREQEALSEAQEANRLKDEFLATVSHELRSPLNSILGWVRLLRAGKLSHDDAGRALETIERNARAQTQLVEDLLDVSRIITGQMRLDFRQVDLATAVVTALDAVRPAAEAKGVRLQTVLDPLAGPISGDEQRLQQIIWNLLSNAVKFTPKGGRVQVMIRRVNSQVEIVVSDTGEGISAEFLPHVFERFKQASSGSTRQYGGLGLGLAIVRHLVELHGGTVRAESPGKGRGATFRVRLPVVSIAEAVSALEKPGGSTPFEYQPVLDGVSVLVVDDDPEARELLSAVLKSCSALVHCAGSGAQAREILSIDHVDVILSDIEMPGEDGYTFIRSVRSGDKMKGIPAVALTAYARSEDRTKALLEGFQSHLSKPVEPAELIAVMANLTGRTGLSFKD